MSARNNLEETFDVMDNIYNIKDLENGEIVETGYAFLEFGSIDSLLDELPEIVE